MHKNNIDYASLSDFISSKTGHAFIYFTVVLQVLIQTAFAYSACTIVKTTHESVYCTQYAGTVLFEATSHILGSCL